MTQEPEKTESLQPTEVSQEIAADKQPVPEAQPTAAQEDTSAPAVETPVETTPDTPAIAAPAESENAVSQDEEAPEAPAETLVEHVSEPMAGDADPTTDGSAPPSAALLTADSMPLVQVVEALLFSTDMPLSAAKLAETCGLDSQKPIKDAIAELNASYEQRQAAYRIEDRAGGYQILTLPQYADYITRLVRKKDEGRLTPAMLESLAIIAYKQPIIRADIEAIRGVGAGEVLRSLMEHNLVKIVGRAEEIGRPMLYGTTRYFLEVFGLASLKDLPKAEQLKEPK